MPDDCLFCRIIAGQIPAARVHVEDRVLAIRDISPQAPTHILILPTEHIASAADLTADHGPLLGRLGLAGYFCRVIVSSDLTAAKPDRAAFDSAIERLAHVETGTLPPVMVGDRLDHDALPALEAGWTGVWLDRRRRGGAPDGVPVVHDLRELRQVLG